MSDHELTIDPAPDDKYRATCFECGWFAETDSIESAYAQHDTLADAWGVTS